jgi:urease accessory protein
MDWLIWQLADSAFPTGGFAHSSGLEAAWQSGEVTTASELSRFVRDCLWQTGHGVLPLASAAHRDPNRLEELDALTDAFLTNTVGNRASRIQGRAFAATCARVWPRPAVVDLEARVQRLHGHAAPVVGAAHRALGVPLTIGQRLLVVGAARGLLAAAVRLGIVGSYEAQRMQHACGPEIDRVLAHCADLDERHVAQTAPVIDLLLSAHDRLYSRLFQS